MQATEHACLLARTPVEKTVCALLVVASLLYYWVVFFHHAANAGQADDFVDVLWFFEIFRAQAGWLDKLAVMALPNHEHVTIINHLVYLADYALFGRLDFFHYMLVGYAIVIACCLVLAAWLQEKIGWWYASALAFTLFHNLFYWHAGFWAMTAISNQAVILFALLAARSAARNPDAICKPLLWSLVAASTQFNGLLVLPALLAASVAVSLVHGDVQRRRQWLVWSMCFLATAGVYCAYENPFASDHLWRYVNYSDPANLQDYIKPSGAPVEISLRRLLDVPLTLLVASGASVFGLVHWLPAAALGMLLLATLLYAGLQSPARADRFWWAVLFFVIASLVLVAVGRGIGFGPASGLLYRYRLYSFLLLMLLAGGLLQRRQIVRFALAAGLLVQLASLHVLDDIGEERDRIAVSHYNWLVDGGMGRSQMPFYPHNQDLRLFNAYQHGYYNPYDAIDRASKPLSVTATPHSECAVAAAEPQPAAVRAWSKKPRALAVELQLDIAPQQMPVSLLFCSDTAAYRVQLGPQNVDSIASRYRPVLVLKKNLPPAQYRVSWLKPGNDASILGTVAFP